MTETKTLTIRMNENKIDINREGLSAEDVIKACAGVIFDLSNNIEASMAEIGFDVVNYGVTAFKHIEGVEDNLSNENENQAKMNLKGGELVEPEPDSTKW